MNRVTPEAKKIMKDMRGRGISCWEIGKTLGFACSTVQYHLCGEMREKAIARAKKRTKEWDGRKEYNRKYQSERYNNDDEFRDRVRTANRENWRRKNGKSNNLS